MARIAIIADGHHRYKTALALQKENPDLETARYRMLTFVNMSNPGLVILPTHRLVQNLEDFDGQKLLDGIEALHHRQQHVTFEQEGKRDQGRQAHCQQGQAVIEMILHGGIKYAAGVVVQPVAQGVGTEGAEHHGSHTTK